MHERKSARSGITYRIDYLRDKRGNLKSPKLYIFWTEGCRSKRASTGTQDSEAAQAILANLILEREAPEKKTREEMTLHAVFEDYLVEHGPSLANLRRAEMSRDKISDYFGNVTVSHITQPNIRAYIKWRRDAEIKDSTINRELVTLRAALRHAVKEDRLESAPYVPRLKEPPAKDVWLTHHEACKLYDAFKRPHLQDFMLIALMTGARSGAIRELKWNQVDFAAKLIRFHPEGATVNAKRRATVPIAPLLFTRLAIMFNRPSRKTDFVLETHKHGNLKGDLSPAFRKASKRAGIKDVSPHVLRHTVATWLAQAGIDAWKISRLLGHSFGGTTERYMHHTPDYLRDVVSVLESICAQFARNEGEMKVFEGGRK